MFSLVGEDFFSEQRQKPRNKRKNKVLARNNPTGAVGCLHLILVPRLHLHPSALAIIPFLVLCAGVGALGASSAFAESMVTLTKSLQVVGSILLDLLRVDAFADCCGVSCVCAYAKCLFFCFI